MNWFDIMKAPFISDGNITIQVPKQKTHVRKPKSGTDMDKCKDKLVQLHQKILNMDLGEKRWENWENDPDVFELEIKKQEDGKFVQDWYLSKITGDMEDFKDTRFDFSTTTPFFNVTIWKHLIIDEIPEEVACKALEMLEKGIPTRFVVEEPSDPVVKPNLYYESNEKLREESAISTGKQIGDYFIHLFKTDDSIEGEFPDKDYVITIRNTKPSQYVCELGISTGTMKGLDTVDPHPPDWAIKAVDEWLDEIDWEWHR